MIKEKWKAYAMSQFLSDWTGDAAALFDALADASHPADIFEAENVWIWEPFAHLEPADVFDKIYTMARECQEIEGTHVQTF